MVIIVFVDNALKVPNVFWLTHWSNKEIADFYLREIRIKQK